MAGASETDVRDSARPLAPFLRLGLVGEDEPVAGDRLELATDVGVRGPARQVRRLFGAPSETLTIPHRAACVGYPTDPQLKYRRFINS